MFRDPWRDYDRWKLMSPEDVEDQRRQREERQRNREDEGDERYDRMKDEGDA